MSLEGKSVEDLQAELAKEEVALAAVGPVSSPNTEMKRPVVQHHEQRIIALKEAIASKGSSWYNPFSWGKKGGRRSRVRGGGWSMGSMITPGSYEYAKYAGAGMDCAGSPVRPGFLSGMSGGKRSGKRSRRSHRSALRSALRSARHHSARRLRSRKSRGGAAAAASTYEYNMMRSTPGTPPGAHTAQKGGRYEMTMGPLVAGSAIGMSGMGMAARIPCEQSTMNPLNQRGGAFPAVQVGAADMRRYEAPTAGYSNQMVPFPAGGAVAGMMTQVPYQARSMNSACLTTGGKRSKRNKRSKRSKRSKRHHRK